VCFFILRLEKRMLTTIAKIPTYIRKLREEKISRTQIVEINVTRAISKDVTLNANPRAEHFHGNQL
jgi:hypothetical protein